MIQATLKEIHRSGFSSPRNVRRILGSVGVTKGAIKHHFGSNQRLGDAVIDEYAREQVLANWVRPIDAADNPIDAIRSRFAKAGEDTLGSLRNLARGLPDDASEAKAREQVKELYELWRNSLARNLARGQRQGTVREDVVSEDVAAHLIAFYEGSITLADGFCDPTLIEVCLRDVDRYLDALRPE